MSLPLRLPVGLGKGARERLSAAAKGRGGAYLVEGRKAVADALARGGVPVREVWAADDLPADELGARARAAAARGVPCAVAPRRDLDRASDTVTPQGALAVVGDVAVAAGSVLAGAKGPALLLDRMQDPGNVGAVFRVAAALGAAGVLVGEGSADPLRAKALRASASTALSVPFARGPLSALLSSCREAGAPLWLLDAGGASVWDLAERPRLLVLAVGSEGAGASPALAEAASARVSIPMAPGVESLNAAVAVAIALAVVSRLPVPKPSAAAAASARGTRRR